MNLRYIGVVVFVNLLCFTNAQENIYDEDFINDSKYKWAQEKFKEFPDKSYTILEESYIYFFQNKDTLKMINCLFLMSDINREKLNYAKSFDHLWEGLYYSNAIERYTSQAVAHRKLAMLYSFYGMYESAMDHTEQAIYNSKMIQNEAADANIQLSVSYLSLASKKRRLGAYEEALSIVDSINITPQFEKSVPWFLSNYELELAQIHIALKHFNIADGYIGKGIAKAQEGDYLPTVLGYKLKGDIARKKFNNELAISHYIRALRIIEEQQVKTGVEAELHSQLSNLYSQAGQYDLAYSELKHSKRISDRISDIRIASSSEIFDINNSYQSSLFEKDATIQKKDKIIQNQNTQRLRMLVIIGLFIMLFVALAVVIWTRMRLRRTLIEKKETELQAELEKERNDIAVNMKNKELASFALQLIDKENSLTELLGTVKEISPDIYKKEARKYASGNKSLWDEFNLRFTEVNRGFYERLIKRFPTLSRTEQKHCALIKLNFSSKEMSHILNVEGQTINMSRSRIRKKMNLERAENLSSVIAGI